MRHAWIVLVGMLVAGAAPANARPTVEVLDPWLREAPPSAPVWAGYMTLKAPPGASDTLLGVSCPDFGHVELHRMTEVGGMARMEPLSAVVVPAGQTVAFSPVASHLMLYDPKHRLKAGDRVTLRFRFQRQGVVTKVAPVRVYKD